MRRSLLLRLLALSLAVALFSIAATAWLTVRDTSERLSGGFDHTLEADGFVYQRLLAYGREHSSWDHAGPTVSRLAEQTGQRVALTTTDGEILADSALSGQGSSELPSQPAADIDSRFTNISITDESADPKLVGLAPDWQQTSAERKRRNALAANATDCFQDRRASNQEVFTVPYGGDLAISTEGAEFSPSDGSRDRRARGGMAAKESPKFTPSVIHSRHPQNSCIPQGLYRPSAAARELSGTEIDLFTRCLNRVGVPYQVAPARFQPREIFGEPAADYSKTELSDWGDCAESAQAKALEPFVASPVQLYIGSAEGFDAFSADAWQRTILTGLAVLAVATAITVVAGRRLTRPIRTLTQAARRMETGDRGARVPIRGGDEMGKLGQAFNAMAESIDEGERQRKTMVSDVAHELRTPLANIRGYLEAAEDGVVPLDPELITSLQEDSSLLQQLVDDLQDLALAESGTLRLRPEEQDAAHLVRQTVAVHRARAGEARISLVADAPQPVAVHADPRRLRQALGNLVTNAVQYTSAGGEVRVSAHRDDSSVVLSVEDNGPGIVAQHLPHVFERFYRTEISRSRGTGGSGLGLAITRHLVEAHGGSVDVSSTQGVGSAFTIRLPTSTTANARG